jgi:hypothetical protein
MGVRQECQQRRSQGAPTDRYCAAGVAIVVSECAPAGNALPLLLDRREDVIGNGSTKGDECFYHEFCEGLSSFRFQNDGYAVSFGHGGEVSFAVFFPKVILANISSLQKRLDDPCLAVWESRLGVRTDPTD